MEEQGSAHEFTLKSAVPKGKKIKLFKESDQQDDPLPKEYQHIRIPERKVKEEFYKTVANLSGIGL